jgi:hypothetical protein
VILHKEQTGWRENGLAAKGEKRLRGELVLDEELARQLQQHGAVDLGFGRVVASHLPLIRFAIII